jgi:hypothetical protein
MEHNTGSWLISRCGGMVPQNTFIGYWKHPSECNEACMTSRKDSTPPTPKRHESAIF